MNLQSRIKYNWNCDEGLNWALSHPSYHQEYHQECHWYWGHCLGCCVDHWVPLRMGRVLSSWWTSTSPRRRVKVNVRWGWQQLLWKWSWCCSVLLDGVGEVNLLLFSFHLAKGPFRCHTCRTCLPWDGRGWVETSNTNRFRGNQRRLLNTT